MFSIHYKNINDFKSLDIAMHYACCRHAWTNLAEDISKGNKIITDQMETYNVDYADNTKGLAWKRVDDRFDTLYGSTYEVPLGDFQEHPESYRVWIYGDSHLQYTGNVFGVCGYPAPEDINIENYKTPLDEVAHNYYDSTYRNTQNMLETNEHSKVYVKSSNSLFTLADVVRASYPNATVTEYGDFTSPKPVYASSAECPIYKVWDDLHSAMESANSLIGEISDEFTAEDLFEYRSLLPTHIVVSGIERCYELGIIYPSAIKSLVEECIDLGIRLVIVTDPFYSDTANYEYFEHMRDNAIYSDFLFDLSDWMSDRDRGYEYIFGDIPSGASYYQIRNKFYNYLPDFAYHAIMRNVFKKWEMPIHRDHYYVSLVYQDIKDNTYSDYFTNACYNMHSGNGSWCITPEGKLSISNSENAISWSDKPPVIQHHVGKYGYDQHPNLFMNTGSFIAVIIHTEYEDSLYAYRQFQANTNYEFLSQNDTASINYTNRPLINTLPVRLYLTGGTTAERHGAHFPVYPCTGAPWFVMSTQNKSDYTYSWNTGDSVVMIDFWLSSPDSYNCTLSLRVRGHHERLDNWQSISFGMFSTTKTANHIHPLYCAGGSLGISNDIYVFTPITGGSKTYYSGNSYDLDFNNICLSNSNLLHPTVMGGSYVSNFKIMSSEGVWKNIFAHVQTTGVVPYPISGPPPDYATYLNSVRFSSNEISDQFLYPTGNIDTRNLISSKYVNVFGHNNITGRNYYNAGEVYGTQFIPVCVFYSRLNWGSMVSDREFLSEGIIPGAYCTYDSDIGVGEYTAQDGKKYLVMPCGWEGRLYDYGHHFGVYNEEWEACDIVDNYENTTLMYKKNPISDRLVIRLV